MTTTPYTITRAESQQDLEDIRSLFRAYEHETGLDLCFQNFEEELATLPGKYGPPDGKLIIVRDENERAVACAAIRSLEQGACELKRLYVRPDARGARLGERLTLALIEDAKQLGYSEMKLDTLPSMGTAVSLYRKLGFQDCPAYYRNPLDGVVYMSLKLL